MNRRIIIVGCIIAFIGCVSILYATTHVTHFTTHSGVYGNILIGPTCPGPERPGMNCSAPYAAKVDVLAEDGKQFITNFDSNANGTFKVNLPPGKYIIQGKSPSSMNPHTGNLPVEVIANTYTKITIFYDTGMR